MVGISALAVWGAACEQPKLDCRVFHGVFIASYTLDTGGPECSDLTAEVIGIESYNPANSDKSYVDTSKGLMAIRTNNVTGIIDEATANGDDSTIIGTPVVNAVGDFASVTPDENDSCHVINPMSSEVSINAIPPNMGEDPVDPADDYPGFPATAMKYEWSNVRVLSSAANPGTLVKADLTYTLNGCTAKYKMVALSPIVDCSLYDADGNPTGEVSDALCDDKADFDLGHPTGSGISQDFAPKCDKNLGICVATKTDLLP